MASRGCVLVVPPFAEEMNKSRRMIALLAARLAESEFSTVVPDLYGTGDSGGDFVDADWSTWRDDLTRVVRWTEASCAPVKAVLGIRLGCALACDAQFLASLPGLERTVFWQPALDGSRYLTQFLRLRIAAAMANGSKESIADLRQALAQAGHLEISGYRLSAQLVADLDALKSPEALPVALGSVAWLELVRDPAQPPTAAITRFLDSSRAAGIDMFVQAYAGEPFWSTTEVVTHEALLEMTLATISGRDAAVHQATGPAR
jgi:exosortase A-associated hydrolase 2